MDLKIIRTELIEEYLKTIPQGLQKAFKALADAELSTPNFSFYTSVASVFSSKIEGVEIELDSYIKHKRDGISFLPDYTRKIDDLYNAYLFAQLNPLSEENVKNAHKLLSKHLIQSSWQGQYRKQNMYVANEAGNIEYVAVVPNMVPTEMKKLLADINTLLDKSLSIEEVFYYAAMIHLVFVKVHPWNDGNGRNGRLLEKWFLAQKLGEKAWFIQSEKMYYQQHQAYYYNLSALGLEYKNLNYANALPFLVMLPSSMPL